MKGANTSAGNQTGHVPLSQPQYPSAPARKPSGIDPESPRKIRAGWKLNSRNPAAAPAIAALAMPRSICGVGPESAATA
ncbi:hypothetical protein AWB68_08431 [Caballeronia choica]|uniref:Uncharacterized protein n=1 Tax=Caballeronia choica TaxID=326476 RepID=A0A158L4B4_9BURK|nr:hypothetical protein AWB68_08431 [Caballeronia choica]